ncbi:hypothetical protein L3Q82_016265 [Scortum barcoo]|uniref:Uncharacterized protein n=1 Tax=Scortum barcoo TaxID=214431 RepID=A0ACB8VR34_9TELE|nr:hypothetical protein L3Q82_016265 [Scortum barcoo]
MYWERFAAECEAAGMRISTSKSEAMVLDRPGKGWRALSRWVERSCLKWRSSSISGSCSRVRERSSVRLTGGLVQRPCSYAVIGVPDRRGEEGAESRKARLSRFTGQSTFPPSPMVMNFGAAAPSHREEESAEVAWASVSDAPWSASLGRCSRHVPPGGGLGEDPGHAGETMSLGWPGNASRVPPEELEEVSGVREVWASLLRLLPPRPGPGPSG